MSDSPWIKRSRRRSTFHGWNKTPEELFVNFRRICQLITCYWAWKRCGTFLCYDVVCFLGIFHYFTGDTAAGNRAMNAATRTSVVLSSGVAAGIFSFGWTNLFNFNSRLWFLRPCWNSSWNCSRCCLWRCCNHCYWRTSRDY